MKKSAVRDRIAATLAKIGPSSPLSIADAIGADPRRTSYHLRAMLHTKQLKAAGKSKDRVYALPGQKLAGAKSIANKDRTQTTSAATPVAALTADRRLVLVYVDDTGAGGRATVFTADFTDPIEQLFKKAA